MYGVSLLSSLQAKLNLFLLKSYDYWNNFKIEFIFLNKKCWKLVPILPAFLLKDKRWCVYSQGWHYFSIQHKYKFLKLYSTGVYKSQEARLMLHIYLIKAPSHTSASKLKEEKWAMDGFVSIFLLQKRGIFFLYDWNHAGFYIQKLLRHIKQNLFSKADSLGYMKIFL